MESHHRAGTDDPTAALVGEDRGGFQDDGHGVVRVKRLGLSGSPT